jgi:hypothetical protein
VLSHIVVYVSFNILRCNYRAELLCVCFSDHDCGRVWPNDFFRVRVFCCLHFMTRIDTYAQAIVNACSGKMCDSSTVWRHDAQVMYQCAHTLCMDISIPCVCNRKWIHCLSALNTVPSLLTASASSTPTHPFLRKSCRVCATMKAQQKMLVNMLQVRCTPSHRPFAVDKHRCECFFSRILRSFGMIRRSLGYGADVGYVALACALALISSNMLLMSIHVAGALKMVASVKVVV